jgi:hypothetical protein
MGPNEPSNVVGGRKVDVMRNGSLALSGSPDSITQMLYWTLMALERVLKYMRDMHQRTFNANRMQMLKALFVSETILKVLNYPPTPPQRFPKFRHCIILR